MVLAPDAGVELVVGFPPESMVDRGGRGVVHHVRTPPVRRLPISLRLRQFLGRNLEALERGLLAFPEAAVLLVLADCQPELDHDRAVSRAAVRKSVDLGIGAGPVELAGQAFDPLHPCTRPYQERSNRANRPTPRMCRQKRQRLRLGTLLFGRWRPPEWCGNSGRRARPRRGGLRRLCRRRRCLEYRIAERSRSWDLRRQQI